MTTMEIFKVLLQFAIGLGVLNVWLLRFNKASKYRGVGASSMGEEFTLYGFPKPIMILVGALKLLFGAGLILGVFYAELIRPSAIGMAILMLGTVLVHLKAAHDDPTRLFPAALMLAFSLLILFL